LRNGHHAEEMPEDFRYTVVNGKVKELGPKWVLER